MCRLAASAWLSATAAATAVAPWPMFRHDTRHTGVGVGSPAAPAPAWTTALGCMIEASPIVDGAGRVIAGCRDGALRAFAVGDGSLLWATPAGLGGELSSPSLGTADAVFVGSLDGGVVAVNASDGTLLWRTPVGGPVWSSPTPSDDGASVYVGCSGDDTGTGAAVYRLHAATGAVVWTAPAPGDVRGSPALTPDGSTVVVGAYDGSLLVLSACRRKWPPRARPCPPRSSLRARRPTPRARAG